MSRLPASSSASANVDDAIHVIVTPSQASYFAGEPFTVTISITNTRTPEAIVPRSASSSATHIHKRGAHSISSVPIARPPTSPGIRTALPAFNRQRGGSIGARNGEGSVLTRKNLIGKGKGVGGAQIQGQPVNKRVGLLKSLSVDLSPRDLTSQEGDTDVDLDSNGKGKSPVRNLKVQESAYPSPTSPRVSSPLARSASVPSNHPHARKQSVMLDVQQLQLQDVRLPTSQSAFPPTPSASTSTFSLSLDPISEGLSTPLPSTPSFPSPINENSVTDVRIYLPQLPTPNGKSKPESIRPSPVPSQPRRPPQLGLGHGPPPNGISQFKYPRSAQSSTFAAPNTELILYSYAQLVGSLSITPLPGTVNSPEQMRNLQYVRTTLIKQHGIGGGSLDIASLNGSSPTYSSLSPSRRSFSHGRSSSLSTGILSLISTSTSAPSSTPTSKSWTPGHKPRTPSMFSGFFSQTSSVSSLNELGIGVGSEEELFIDPEKPLPTFEVQPTMLAVDLTLGPGESRSYTYTITLPENLPPTFRGRSLRFSYQFILGICRAASIPGTGNSSSRVMKVPIRIYNHVSVVRPPSPYDILWPVALKKRRAAAPTAKVIEVKGHPINTNSDPTTTVRSPSVADTAPQVGTYEDLESYARSLSASVTIKNPTLKLNGNGISANLPPLVGIGSHPELLDEEEVAGCREAVEILTRNPKKLSYDVNKDGVKVAVLTFTKSAYRLGESVLGVVELNDRSSRARVLKLSALLEAHESLPSCIASSNNSRHLRRIHAEQHSSFMGSTLRTTFSLDIPPEGSPAFQVDVIEDGANLIRSTTPIPTAGGSPSPGGLEWKVRLYLLVAVASATSNTNSVGVRLRNMVRDGPGGEWGSSWKASSSIAPMERRDPKATQIEPEQVQSPSSAIGWVSYFANALIGSTENGYHDGDEEIEEDATPTATPDEELAMWGTEEEWRDVKVEMVECEVPIKVWPGNTAFKATEVIFDV
ncbi:Reduced growth phenotype protein 1 [Abortiporus biennis]